MPTYNAENAAATTGGRAGERRRAAVCDGQEIGNRDRTGPPEPWRQPKGKDNSRKVVGKAED